MNNNINIAEILRDCPKGTKLYSPLYGEVELKTINNDLMFPIVTEIVNKECKLKNNQASFSKDGTFFGIPNTECVIFPSQKMRDWSKFSETQQIEPVKAEPVKPTCPFKPFDKVLVRDDDGQEWKINFFSHYDEKVCYKYRCLKAFYKQCILYEGNEHLFGTTDPYTEE